MLKEIVNHIQARRSFAFETTLSGRGYLQLIRRLRSSGWRVELVDLALPSVELSILRVAERVAHGGHDVPLSVLRRRFPRSLQLLLDAYAPAVDHARVLPGRPEAHHRGSHPLCPASGTSPMSHPLSPSDQQILEALEQAVAAELDRKARLGHYIATWQDGRAVLVGPDAPPPQER